MKEIRMSTKIMDAERRNVRLGLLFLWGTFAAFVLVQWLMVAPVSAAPGGEKIQIASFDLQNLSKDGKASSLRIMTRDGRSIPKENIIYQARGDVLRITFKNTPLMPRLGLDVPVDATDIPGVAKAYVLKENNWQSFARIRFAGKAKEALKNGEIVPIKGGVELRFPFGEKIEMAAAPAATPEKREATKEMAANDKAANDKAANDKAANDKAADKKIANAANKKAAEGESAFGWAKPGKSNAKSTAAGDNAIAKSETEGMAAPTTNTTPIKLADENRGASLSRVLGALAVIVMLMLALAFLYRKMQELKGSRTGLKITTDSVNVLSSHRVGKDAKVVVMDVLGEVLVVGQGQGGLSLLHRLNPSRVRELQSEPTPDMSEFETQSLLAKMLSQPLEPAGELDPKSIEVLEQIVEEEGSLQELSASLGPVKEDQKAGFAGALQKRESLAKAEDERIADRKRANAEKERLENERLAAEQAQIAEQQRIAAEQAQIAEQQRLAAEQAQIAEQQRIAAEQAQIAEQQRIAAEQQRILQAQQAQSQAGVAMIRTSPAHGVAGGDAEPASEIHNHEQRAQVLNMNKRRTDKNAPLGRKQPAEILSIRDRARSMGRL